MTTFLRLFPLGLAVAGLFGFGWWCGFYVGLRSEWT